MKEKWLEMSWFQRVLLLLQAFLILLFLPIYCTIGSQQVVWYDGAALRCHTDGEITTYSGRVNGQAAVITVSPGPVVEYQFGDALYGPYSIISDPSAVPSEEAMPMIIGDIRALSGVEIRQGDRVLFRGSYLNSGSTFLAFDETGEWATSSMLASDSGLSAKDILQIALAPQIVQRGHIEGFLLGLLLCVACAVSIVYADELFRFHLAFQIRDPENAEPSDWELFGRSLSWVVLTVLSLILFVFGLNSH